MVYHVLQLNLLRVIKARPVLLLVQLLELAVDFFGVHLLQARCCLACSLVGLKVHQLVLQSQEIIFRRYWLARPLPRELLGVNLVEEVAELSLHASSSHRVRAHT